MIAVNTLTLTKEQQELLKKQMAVGLTEQRPSPQGVTLRKKHRRS